MSFFCLNSTQLKRFNYFCRTLDHKCLTRFQMHFSSCGIYLYNTCTNNMGKVETSPAYEIISSDL